MELRPDDHDHLTLYKLLTGSVVPRPIAWVSTVSKGGTANLAPFSFFTAVSAKPPHLLFCPGQYSSSRPKDTLQNVRDSGEFVVNVVTERLAEAMNLSAAAVAPALSEFDFAGVTPAPSALVKAPRVLESPVHFECRLVHLYSVGEGVGGGSVVIGEVVHIHVDERVMLGPDKIDIGALGPIGRLAGAAYSRVSDTFEMVRPSAKRFEPD